MIYLDNAATSFPKPETVPERMSYALRELGGNPGRSSHRLSMLADREVFACRCEVAELFGAKPENVIFTYNATYALNMAIKSSYESGAVLISDLEHNSLRRPALALGAEVRIFNSKIELSGSERTEAILKSIKSKLGGVRLLCCTAASNICGATLPIREIGELCREHGVRFIVDGAQAGGRIPLDLVRDNIDILCLPGHKGLFGPQGSGMMLIADGVRMPSFIEGGSGIGSLDTKMPELPPERYEAGTLAVPAIAGLRMGIEYINEQGMDYIRAHESDLAREFADRLRKNRRVTLFEPACIGDDYGSIVLFKLTGYDCEDAARLLDTRGVCLRAGYHCSPLAHRRIGTGRGGALRASFGAFNTPEEVAEAARIVSGI